MRTVDELAKELGITKGFLHYAEDENFIAIYLHGNLNNEKVWSKKLKMWLN